MACRAYNLKAAKALRMKAVCVRRWSDDFKKDMKVVKPRTAASGTHFKELDSEGRRESFTAFRSEDYAQ